jgi:hypothetical protein
MNRDAYTLITKSSPKPTTVHVADITGPDRTLLYGYTCDRETWHVYLENDTINWVKYWDRGEKGGELTDAGSADEWVASELVPDKRVYPEFTDYAFACDLRDAGVDVPYTSFSEERYQLSWGRAFHGLRRTDLH